MIAQRKPLISEVSEIKAIEPFEQPSEQFSLKRLLTPQLKDRIAAGRTLESGGLGIEPISAPVPAPAKPVGKVSKRQALEPVVSVSEDIVAQQSLEDTSAAFPSLKGVLKSSRRSFFPIFNQILGTSGDDDITATEQPDYVNGFGGNDTIRGDNGDDILVGAAGDDVISGDHVPSRTYQSNDIIAGGSGNDLLFGRIGKDLLIGGSGDDQIFGGSGSDRINGGSGDDQIFGGIVAGDQSFNPDPDERDILVGGIGSDYIDGGEGNDVIVGSNWKAAGAGELDLLTGGAGNDIFVLGTRYGAHYIQGGASQDFAIILDFEQGDRVRLHGDASQYVLAYDATENATALGYLGGGGFELVGVFADADLSDMSLTSSAFQYVS